jgi:geranylgeranyl pyrophosphate synthase
LLEECGAREETVALADAHLAAALGALDRVPLEPGPKAELVAIAKFVTERDR